MIEIHSSKMIQKKQARVKTWSAILVRQMREHQKFPKSHKCGVCVPGVPLSRGKVQEGPRGWQWYFSMYSYSRSKL